MLPSRPPSAIAPTDRLRACDLAQLESCSISTARRLLKIPALGPVHGRNARDRWIDRHTYLRWLDTK